MTPGVARRDEVPRRWAAPPAPRAGAPVPIPPTSYHSFRRTASPQALRCRRSGTAMCSRPPLRHRRAAEPPAAKHRSRRRTGRRSAPRCRSAGRSSCGSAAGAEARAGAALRAAVLAVARRRIGLGRRRALDVGRRLHARLGRGRGDRRLLRGLRRRLVECGDRSGVRRRRGTGLGAGCGVPPKRSSRISWTFPLIRKKTITSSRKTRA